ncbi:MAG: 2-hydroxyacyl-CoA dehydratase, partial [Clostridia bacterium]|nr:2-hydroxyacyl-CoA dehydratase [Clostridia bacterium]
MFTKEMRKTHRILMPSMLPIHFEIFVSVFRREGYDVELLRTQSPKIVQTGLKYVNNDTCYPAILVIGQFIHALQSGKYDPDRTALMITQTGGGCRASNYIHLLRKALISSGFENVPVISLNLAGIERTDGFTITLDMLRKMIAAAMYGDEIMLLSNQVRPYEETSGQTDAIVNEMIRRTGSMLAGGEGYSLGDMTRTMRDIAQAFAHIPVVERKTIKTGIVGEIYVKYSPLANNNLEAFLASHGCEVMLPGVMNFLTRSLHSSIYDNDVYGGGIAAATGMKAVMGYLRMLETAMIKAVSETYLRPPATFEQIRRAVGGVIGEGVKMGEGWLLTGEMLDMANEGFENILCLQPFGCLPNHIVGRGML